MRALAKLSRKLGTARALLRDVGPGRFVVVALQRLPGIGSRVRMVVLTRSHSIPSLPMSHNVVYRRLHPGERLPLELLPARGVQTPEFRQARFTEALDRGSEGFVAELDGRIVAYTWAAYHRHLIPEVWFELALGPDEACTYASYVMPAFRYTRVYGGLARFQLTSLRDRGTRSFVGYANLASRHSVHAHRRLGYEVIGCVLLIRLPFVALQVTRLATDGGRRRWRWLAGQQHAMGRTEAIASGGKRETLRSHAPSLRGRPNG